MLLCTSGRKQLAESEPQLIRLCLIRKKNWNKKTLHFYIFCSAYILPFTFQKRICSNVNCSLNYSIIFIETFVIIGMLWMTSSVTILLWIFLIRKFYIQMIIIFGQIGFEPASFNSPGWLLFWIFIEGNVATNT